MPHPPATFLSALHSRLKFVAYRYRCLTMFIVIGSAAILAELAVFSTLPTSLDLRLRAVGGFVVSLGVSFALNAWLNFRVPAQYLASTFARYTVVSVASFVLNLAVVDLLRDGLSLAYPASRLISSGCLFLLAYTAHRLWTFEEGRNFGIAVYLTRTESIASIRSRVGMLCDHIHADLVDTTMNPLAQEVCTERLAEIRRTWPGLPVAVHVMSRTPSVWMWDLLPHADWILFHLDIDEELLPLIAQCRRQKQKPGIVWHRNDSLESLMPWLPHVDFVMILGIETLGCSGQPLSDAAVDMAAILHRLRERYGFELMFDGSVNPTTIRRIPAKYIVAASAVLQSPDPIDAICCLKTGGRYDRRAD